MKKSNLQNKDTKEVAVNEDIKEIAKNGENIWTKPQILQQMVQQELVLAWLQAWESVRLSDIIFWHKKGKPRSTTWNNLLLRGSDQNLFNIAWLSNNHWGRLLQVQCLIFNIFSNRFLSCCPEMTHLDDYLRGVLLQILRCRRCLETSS